MSYFSPFIFERNGKALQKENHSLWQQLVSLKKDPSISVLPCSKNGCYVQIGETPLNSKMDSIRESQNLIARKREEFEDKSTIIIFGIELGYLTQAVLKEFPHINVTVLEHRVQLIEKALEIQDFSDKISSQQLKIIPITKLDGAEIYFQHMDQHKTQLLIHIASFNMDADFYAPLKTIFYNILSLKTINETTINRFDSLWLRNIIRNLATYTKYPGIEILNGICLKQPVILVAAGPSLYLHQDFLIKNQDKVMIIAVNTALTFLLEIGVTPHIVVVVDPQPKIMQHFITLWRKKDTVKAIPLLVAESTVYPSIINQYKGPVLFTEVSLLKGMINPIAHPKHHLDSGGSVITTAYSLAIAMKASPIIFIGLDLSTTNKTMHTKGNELEKTWYFDTQTRFNPIEKSHFLYVNQLSTKPYQGFFGEHVMVNETFYTYIQWLENRFSYYKEAFLTYNCTQGGIGFKMIPNVTLDSLNLEKTLLDPISHPALLVQSHAEYQDRIKGFIALFQEMVVQLKQIQNKTQEGTLVFKDLHQHIIKKTTISASKLQKATEIEEELLKALSHIEAISLNIQTILYNLEKNPSLYYLKEDEKDPSLQNIRKSLVLFDAIDTSCTIVIKELKRFIEKNLRTTAR